MNYLKLLLAVLLLLCLAPMPYGYYQLVRIVDLLLWPISTTRRRMCLWQLPLAGLLYCSSRL